MVPVNKKTNKFQLVAGALPAMLSMSSMMIQSWIMLLLCVLSLFIVVGFVPIFKRRENLYMFILVAIAGLPINIRLSYWIVEEAFFGSGFFVGDIILGTLICCVFFSVEEVFFGVITRMIWKKQYKIKI